MTRLEKLQRTIIHFGSLKTTEAVEDDIVCGIEITPCASDSLSTLSTIPISSNESQAISWSDASQSTSDSFPQNTYLVHSFSCENVNCPSWDTSNSSKDVVFDGICDEYYEFSTKRNHSFIGPLTPKEHQFNTWQLRNRSENPNFCLGRGYVLPAQYECSSDAYLSEHGLLHSFAERDNCPDFINLVESEPERLHVYLTQSIASTLCQLTTRASDTPTISNDSTRQKLALQPQNSAYTQQESLVISLQENTNTIMILLSGPLVHLSSVMNILEAGRISSRKMSIHSFFYQQNIAKMLTCDSVLRSAVALRVQLKRWSRHITNKESNSKETGSCLDSDGTKIICTPKMLPLAYAYISEGQKNDVNLIQDVELKAVLNITDGGNSASALFPTFSSDSILVCESDDGLSEELYALDSIGSRLREELENAEQTLKYAAQSAHAKVSGPPAPTIHDDGDPYSYHLVEIKQKLKALERIERSLRKAMSRADKIISQVASDDDALDDTTVSTDVSSTESKSPGPSVKSSRSVRMPGTDGRKVHFAAEHQEFVFVTDTSNSWAGSGEDGPEVDESSGFLGKLEDVYYACEDIMDEMAFSCTKFFESNRPSATSSTVPIRRSTIHFV
jgi:hypothetical protein